MNWPITMHSAVPFCSRNYADPECRSEY